MSSLVAPPFHRAFNIDLNDASTPARKYRQVIGSYNAGYQPTYVVATSDSKSSMSVSNSDSTRPTTRSIIASVAPPFA